MEEIQLTEGAIAAMADINNKNKPHAPVLQVSEIRQVFAQNAGGNSERYRLLLSDGVHLQQGMLATQRNVLVHNGHLQRTSVIQLTQFVCNVIQHRSIIIIIELEVIKDTWPVLGDPKPYLSAGEKPTAQVQSPIGMIPGDTQHRNPHAPVPVPIHRPSETGSLQQPKMERGGQTQSYSGSSATNPDSGRYVMNNGRPMYPKSDFSAGVSGNAAAVGGSYGGFNNADTDVSRAPPSSYIRPQQPAYQQQPSMYLNRGPISKNEAPPRIVPIAALNPYQSRWTIKARVTAKGELRQWSNAKGDGKVFSFDLLDSDGGEIRVTCFNAVAEQFYGQVDIGKVYLISKGNLKQAQKAFNHLPNDYEIFLDTTSVVQPCFDDDSRIPRQQFHFRPISDIEGIDQSSFVDVIGIVFSISPSSSIMKKNGTETQKRSLQLKDMSGRSVELTLWGNFCNGEGQTLQNLCDTGNYPVLAVKTARVSEFNGKQIGTISTTQLFVEPDFPEAQKLKEWFDREGRNTPSVSISRETTNLIKTDVRKTISQIKDEKLGTSEKPDWITVCATLSFIKMDNFYYPACPILIGDRQCNKKVTNNGDGKWRCDRCDQSVDECDYRYILQFQIQDHTSLTWVTGFQECGEEILGISAKDLVHLKHEEQDYEKVQEIIRAALFNKYIFKLKVKEETFNDEQRVKSTVVKAERASFVAESRSLLDLIQKVKAGDLGTSVAKAEIVSANMGPNRSGLGHVGTGQPAVSGASYGTNPSLGRDTGGFSSNTSQYGNQYSGGYVGANASGMHTTCSSCGGIGHSSTNCPSIINGPGQPSGTFGNQAVPGANAGSNLSECYKCHKLGHFARDCPGLGAVPPAYGGSNVVSGRYSGGQRQHVGGF